MDPIIQDICDDYLMMKTVDFIGKIGEKAHVGSTTSEELRDLFLSSNFTDIEIEKMKLNWFWGIMIGKGIKRDNLRQGLFEKNDFCIWNILKS